MSIKRKTYGVPGMMEWIANIHCGKATVKVHFTGGSLSGYGVVPAEYTTENPFIQQVIERSQYFNNGKIILIREVEGTGKYKEVAKEHHADAGTHIGGVATTASAVMDSALNPDGKPVADATGTGTEKEPDANASGTRTTGDAETTEDGKAVVEVTDIDDARDYLSEEFDVPRSSIRSNASVFRCAEEHNIVFKGI